MKHKSTILSLTLLLSFITALTLDSVVKMQDKTNPDLKLKLRTNKSAYMLGEPINFIFELKNISVEKIHLNDEFSVYSGMVNLQVSLDGINYIRSNSSDWGLVDYTSNGVIIEPEQILSSTGNILSRKSIDNQPEFLFYQPAKLFFKFDYTFVLKDNLTEKYTLASEPVEVNLFEPSGEDLIVWNKIKSNGNFAYFILRGSPAIPMNKVAERERFIKEVNQIITDHPTSLYTAMLMTNLEKYRLYESNWDESRRKIHDMKKIRK